MMQANVTYPFTQAQTQYAQQQQMSGAVSIKICHRIVKSDYPHVLAMPICRKRTLQRLTDSSTDKFHCLRLCLHREIQCI